MVRRQLASGGRGKGGRGVLATAIGDDVRRNKEILSQAMEPRNERI